MKFFILLIALSTFSSSATAEDKNIGAVIAIVTTLLLDEDEEKPEPPVCEVAYTEPSAGFEVKNMCKARGLMAALLNTRAGALSIRGRNEAACEAAEQYLACGFQTDINGRACNSLRRSFNRYGIAALSIDCEPH